jgi:hypothetical protein
MSEQHKSTFQAFGAALLGFVAVVALGGGAMLLHSSHKAKAPPKPVPAAEPIDLASPAPRGPEPIAPIKEIRTESPAPLVGSDDETEVADAPFAARPGGVVAPPADAYASVPADAVASSPASSPNAAPGMRRLQPAEHLDLASSGGSPAKAGVAIETPAARKAAKLASSKKPMAKIAPAAPQPASVASVHYGVTSRDELMGRAAGPVYNIKSGSSDLKAKPESGGKMASEMNERLAGLQSKLEEDTSLSPAQRADIQTELSNLKKGVADIGGSR